MKFDLVSNIQLVELPKFIIIYLFYFQLMHKTTLFVTFYINFLHPSLSILLIYIFSPNTIYNFK